MKLHKVEARFKDQVRNLVVMAEDIHDAAYIVGAAYEEDRNFLYVSDIVEAGDIVSIDPPSPTPSETPRGIHRFNVEVDVNGIGHHYYVEAGDWNDAQTMVDRAYKTRCDIIEITRLTDLPRRG